METVYIEHDNCIIHQSSDHLIIKKRGCLIGTIPLINVNCIVVLGGVQITSAAIELLFQKNIDVIYTSKGGKIKGTIQSQTGGGAVLRIAQHHAFVDQMLRGRIARNIVYGKIQNQVRLLERYKRYYAIKDLGDITRKMDQLALNAVQTLDTEKIMGYEGASAKLYWSSYSALVKNRLFARREYRPAPDIVNSALNLGYSFLASEITSCLVAEKFDIEIGFLHSVHYGRASLALDIMEEFRTQTRKLKDAVISGDDYEPYEWC